MKIRLTDYIHLGLFPQILAAVSGTLFAISDGMTFCWTAPFIPYFESAESHILASELQLEWLESGFLIGSGVGLPITMYLVEKAGRKKAILLASSIVLVAWTLIAFANRIEYILVARFIFGISGNMAFVAAPMYIAEIADQRIRGFLASIIYIMVLLGCLIVYSVGPYLPFWTPSAIGVAVILIEITVFSTVPESPAYLYYANRKEAAAKSLRYFKPYADIERELQILAKAIDDQTVEKGRLKDLFLVPSNRKCIIIMAILNAGQHFSAYSVILMNMHYILQKAGSIYMDSSHAAIAFAALMLVAVAISSSQIDRFGRKILLILSSSLTGFCLLAISVYFHLMSIGYDVRAISWIPIASVMAYAIVFKTGIGLVPIVLTAEIFPANLKAIGMTLADAMYFIGGILSIQLYQLLKHYGLYIPFYIFTVCSFLVALFTALYIPETKGKSLDEIQKLLKGIKLKTPNEGESEQRRKDECGVQQRSQVL